MLRALVLLSVSFLVGNANSTATLAAVPVATGALSVSSDPASAAVYVDGRFIGQTPINVSNLGGGDHRVRLVKNGYLENSRVIRVAEGQTNNLNVRLTVRASQTTAVQSAGLHIVVLEGEGSVNIIRQNTAVRPTVEVRDRNDLPVAGATVLFTIGGRNSATFVGGGQTFTVTTDPAGRAVASALNPVSAGQFQIAVQATFQGQTAAATIAQVNVATAAAASGATATAAGAAAGGGGAATGGLSALAIGAIAGGAAAGTLVAVKAAGGDSSDKSTTTFTGAITIPFVENRSFTGPSPSACATTGTFNFNLSLALEQHADGTVKGTLTLNGNAVESATSCKNYTPTTDPITGGTDLTGTTGSFGASDGETGIHSDSNGGTYNETGTMSVQCSLSNGVVTMIMTILDHKSGISGLPPGVVFTGDVNASGQTTLR